MKAFEEAGFRYACITEDEFATSEDTVPISCKLKMVVFWLEEGVDLMRRFCSGHVYQIDATFATNKLRIPMMTSVGLTNEGTNLPCMVGYVPGETTDAYSFFIGIGNSEIFGEAILEPDVYLIDGSASMAAAVAAGVIGDAKH